MRIALATEDELSEQLGLRLLEEYGLEVAHKFRKGGSGYLKSRLATLCDLAEHEAVLLITDLDQAKCASALIKAWLGNRKLPANLLLRVAVREVESWIIADHPAVCELLRCPSSKVPKLPDELPDPKQTLMSLARYAPRRLRDEIVVPRGAIASQGLGYNAVLCRAVRDYWSSERAALRSPSLRRARQRLMELAARC